MCVEVKSGAGSKLIDQLEKLPSHAWTQGGSFFLYFWSSDLLFF